MADLSNHYVDGELMGELASEASKSGAVPNELAEMFYTLAKHSLAASPYSSPRAFGFQDCDDAIQEAVMKCLQIIPKFDASKLKHKHYAYYYFRMVIHQTYSKLYQYHRRQMRDPSQEVRIDNIDQVFEHPGELWM